MLSRLRQLTPVVFLFCALQTPAVVLYVDLNSTNPTPPLTNWITAATNIRDAIDVADPGDEVLVTNGIYQAGRLTSDGTTNVVAVTNALSLRSLNGPTATLINGGNAKRCVYLTDGAVLEGFTLANGNARNGGGVWCASTTATVFNCLLVSNSATSGGGAYPGTLTNCTLSGRACPFTGTRGGASESIANGCTLRANVTGRACPNGTDAKLGGDAAGLTLIRWSPV